MEVPLSLETDSRSRRCWRRRSSQFSDVQKRNNYTQLISSSSQSINVMTCVKSDRERGEEDEWRGRRTSHERTAGNGRSGETIGADYRINERGERRCCGVWSAAEAESADCSILGPHSDNNRPVIEANMRVMAGALEWTTIIALWTCQREPPYRRSGCDFFQTVLRSKRLGCWRISTGKMWILYGNNHNGWTQAWDREFCTDPDTQNKLLWVVT